jgi:hypothetical protein
VSGRPPLRRSRHRPGATLSRLRDGFAAVVAQSRAGHNARARRIVIGSEGRITGCVTRAPGPCLAFPLAAGVPPADTNGTHLRPLMHRSLDRYVPDASVRQSRQDDVTVLTSSRTGERHTLSRTGAEVWTLLNRERQTVDRLVMALARQSSGQALAEVPDVVREQLDSFVQRGFVDRVAIV